MEQTDKGLRFYRIICRSTATLLFATFIFTWFHLAIAQQPEKLPRIGYIAPTGPENTNYAAFLRGLRDLGYIEGKNILVEYRSMEGNRDRIPSLMAELGATAGRYPCLPKRTNDPCRQTGDQDDCHRHGG
jgi:hypothetical protein